MPARPPAVRGTALLLAIVASSATGVATRAQAQQRSRGSGDRAAEARAIVRSLLADDAPLQPCQFDVAWNPAPVPRGLATRQLGSAATADVIPLPPLPPLPTLRDAADPFTSRSGIFCTDQEYLDHLTHGASGGRQDPPQRAKLSFPLFNGAMTRAIVISTSVANDPSRPSSSMRDGQLDLRLATVALIYERQPSGWDLAETVVLDIR